MLEKMSIKDAASVRANLYEDIISNLGFEAQPIKGGTLIHLTGDYEGYFAKISVSVCDPSKVDEYIQEYADQQIKNAQIASERAARAEEKARKAAERAEKKKAKEAE